MAYDQRELQARSVGCIQHVVLIGFHHKKGSVIEYCYPPLCSDSDKAGNEAASFLPEEWQVLPSLAMPDGAHNFVEDVVYFHLPPRKIAEDESRDEACGGGGGNDETVYCVSYCRQVDACKLSQRDEDITRGTVQKSVVILSKVPAFGLIHTKLQLPLITNAFLENFSNKKILQELYHQLNFSLNISDESHYFFGLDCRKHLITFRHKFLALFKLILLERRVIFYTTPASQLADTIFSLLSLLPRMIQTGLSHATEIRAKVETSNSESENGKKVENSVSDNSSGNTEAETTTVSSDDGVNTNMNSTEGISQPPTSGQSISRPNMMDRFAGRLNFFGRSSPQKLNPESVSGSQEDSEEFHHLDPEQDDDDDVYAMKWSNARLEMDVGSPEKSVKPEQKQPSEEDVPEYLPPSPFDTDAFGFPINLFSDGHLCLPYVSLQQHDLLKNCSQTGFLAGATNILFVTQRELCDAVVDIEAGDITFHDAGLQKIVSSSPADLRFVEHIMNNVLEKENDDYFNTAAEWKGGDEWLRSMFSEYLHRMLCVVSANPIDSRKAQDFNESFVKEWKKTRNFRAWKQGNYQLIEDPTECQHPFHGQFSINDVRLRLHHKLQDSEQGRRIEGALSNANDTIVNTGRYIGNAFGSAKSWFSNKLQSHKNQ